MRELPASTASLLVPGARPTASRWRRRRAQRAARSGRRSTRRCSSSSQRTARRSSSSTTAGSPSGSRCGSTSSPSEEIARAHHGSLAREQRVEIEELLKRGEIPCLVATSSLELGIDMGAVDLVIQVESPKSVARGLQRIGRAGHELGAVSKGRIFPKFRADLLESRRRREGDARRRDRGDGDPAQPARRARAADRRDLRRRGDRGRRPARARHAAPTRSPSSRAQQLENVLDMLAGRYPSDEFAELRPRIVWDRTGGRRARPRRRAPAGGHERGHDPRPRPLRRLPGRRRRPGRRARRGDGVRGPRGADVPARRLDLADRGDHARPRARLAGARRAGRGAVLEGRGRRAAVRARREDRPRLARARGALRREGARAPRRRLPPRRARRPATSSPSCASRPRRRRRRARPTGRSSSSASATRSATGASAS